MFFLSPGQLGTGLLSASHTEAECKKKVFENLRKKKPDFTPVPSLSKGEVSFLLMTPDETNKVGIITRKAKLH
jgi:hypothetical protein